MDLPIRPIPEAVNARPSSPFTDLTPDLIALASIAEHWRKGGIVLHDDLLTFVRSSGRVLAVIDELAEGEQ